MLLSSGSRTPWCMHPTACWCSGTTVRAGSSRRRGTRRCAAHVSTTYKGLEVVLSGARYCAGRLPALQAYLSTLEELLSRMPSHGPVWSDQGLRQRTQFRVMWTPCDCTHRRAEHLAFVRSGLVPVLISCGDVLCELGRPCEAVHLGRRTKVGALFLPTRPLRVGPDSDGLALT